MGTCLHSKRSVILMDIQHLLLILFSVVSSVTCSNERTYYEANHELKQFVERSGKYILESHEVATDDRHLLLYHRLLLQNKSNTPGPPLLFQHGLLASSEVFLRPQYDSLAYFLADNGFDVWLGNNRGNQFWNSSNVPFSNSDIWGFSLHEQAVYDLAAGLDKILNITNSESLTIIAHSHGAAQAIALAASRPDYSLKITSLVALAPVVFCDTSVNDSLPQQEARQLLTKIFDDMVHQTDHEEFIVKPRQYLYEKECYKYSDQCASLFNRIQGTISKEMWNDIRHFVPTRSSKKSLNYVIQQFKNGVTFKQFDYGKEINKLQYLAEEAPIYDLGFVDFPVHMFNAMADVFISQKEISILHQRLSDSTIHSIEISNFNHFDFLWGRNLDTTIGYKVKSIITSTKKRSLLREESQLISKKINMKKKIDENSRNELSVRSFITNRDESLVEQSRKYRKYLKDLFNIRGTKSEGQIWNGIPPEALTNLRPESLNFSTVLSISDSNKPLNEKEYRFEKDFEASVSSWAKVEKVIKSLKMSSKITKIDVDIWFDVHNWMEGLKVEFKNSENISIKQYIDSWAAVHISFGSYLDQHGFKFDKNTLDTWLKIQLLLNQFYYENLHISRLIGHWVEIQDSLDRGMPLEDINFPKEVILFYNDFNSKLKHIRSEQETGFAKSDIKIWLNLNSHLEKWLSLQENKYSRTQILSWGRLQAQMLQSQGKYPFSGQDVIDWMNVEKQINEYLLGSKRNFEMNDFEYWIKVKKLLRYFKGFNGATFSEEDFYIWAVIESNVQNGDGSISSQEDIWEAAKRKLKLLSRLVNDGFSNDQIDIWIKFENHLSSGVILNNHEMNKNELVVWRKLQRHLICLETKNSNSINMQDLDSWLRVQQEVSKGINKDVLVENHGFKKIDLQLWSKIQSQISLLRILDIEGYSDIKLKYWTRLQKHLITYGSFENTSFTDEEIDSWIQTQKQMNLVQLVLEYGFPSKDLDSWAKIQRVVQNNQSPSKGGSPQLEIDRWMKIQRLIKYFQIFLAEGYTKEEIKIWNVIQANLKNNDSYNEIPRNHMRVWKLMKQFSSEIEMLQSMGFSFDNVAAYSEFKWKLKNGNYVKTVAVHPDGKDIWSKIQNKLRFLRKTRQYGFDSKEVEAWVKIKQIVKKGKNPLDEGFSVWDMDAWSQLEKFNSQQNLFQQSLFSNNEIRVWVKMEKSKPQNITLQSQPYSQAEILIWNRVQEYLVTVQNIEDLHNQTYLESWKKVEREARQLYNSSLHEVNIKSWTEINNFLQNVKLTKQNFEIAELILWSNIQKSISFENITLDTYPSFERQIWEKVNTLIQEWGTKKQYEIKFWDVESWVKIEELFYTLLSSRRVNITKNDLAIWVGIKKQINSKNTNNKFINYKENYNKENIPTHMSPKESDFISLNDKDYSHESNVLPNYDEAKVEQKFIDMADSYHETLQTVIIDQKYAEVGFEPSNKEYLNSWSKINKSLEHLIKNKLVDKNEVGSWFIVQQSFGELLVDSKLKDDFQNWAEIERQVKEQSKRTLDFPSYQIDSWNRICKQLEIRKATGKVNLNVHDYLKWSKVQTQFNIMKNKDESSTSQEDINEWFRNDKYLELLRTLNPDENHSINGWSKINSKLISLQELGVISKSQLLSFLEIENKMKAIKAANGDIFSLINIRIWVIVQNEVDKYGLLPKHLFNEKDIDIWLKIKQNLKSLQKTQNDATIKNDIELWIDVRTKVENGTGDNETEEYFRQWSSIQNILDAMHVLKDTLFSMNHIEVWWRINDHLNKNKIIYNDTILKEEFKIWKELNEFIKVTKLLFSSGYAKEDVLSWIQLQWHAKYSTRNETDLLGREGMSSLEAIGNYIRKYEAVNNSLEMEENLKVSWNKIQSQLEIMKVTRKISEEDIKSWMTVQQFKIWLVSKNLDNFEETFSLWVYEKTETETLNSNKAINYSKLENLKQLHSLLKTWESSYRTKILLKNITSWQIIDEWLKQLLNDKKLNVSSDDIRNWKSIQLQSFSKNNLSEQTRPGFPTREVNFAGKGIVYDKPNRTLPEIQTTDGIVTLLTENYRQHLAHIFGLHGNLENSSNNRPQLQNSINISSQIKSWDGLYSKLQVLKSKHLISQNDADRWYKAQINFEILKDKTSKGFEKYLNLWIDIQEKNKLSGSITKSLLKEHEVEVWNKINDVLKDSEEHGLKVSEEDVISWAKVQNQLKDYSYNYSNEGEVVQSDVDDSLNLNKKLDMIQSIHTEVNGKETTKVWRKINHQLNLLLKVGRILSTDVDSYMKTHQNLFLWNRITGSELVKADLKIWSEVQSKIDLHGSVSTDIASQSQINTWLNVQKTFNDMRSFNFETISKQDIEIFILIDTLLANLTKPSEKQVDTKTWFIAQKELEVLDLSINVMFTKNDINCWIKIANYINNGNHPSGGFSEEELVTWTNINEFLDILKSLKYCGYSKYDIHNWAKIQNLVNSTSKTENNTSEELAAWTKIHDYLHKLRVVQEGIYTQANIDSWVRVQQNIEVLVSAAGFTKQDFESWETIKLFKHWITIQRIDVQEVDLINWAITELDVSADKSKLNDRPIETIRSWKLIKNLLPTWEKLYRLTVSKEVITSWLKVKRHFEDHYNQERQNDVGVWLDIQSSLVKVDDRLKIPDHTQTLQPHIYGTPDSTVLGGQGHEMLNDKSSYLQSMSDKYEKKLHSLFETQGPSHVKEEVLKQEKQTIEVNKLQLYSKLNDHINHLKAKGDVSEDVIVSWFNCKVLIEELQNKPNLKSIDPKNFMAWAKKQTKPNYQDGELETQFSQPQNEIWKHINDIIVKWEHNGLVKSKEDVLSWAKVENQLETFKNTKEIDVTQSDISTWFNVLKNVEVLHTLDEGLSTKSWHKINSLLQDLKTSNKVSSEDIQSFIMVQRSLNSLPADVELSQNDIYTWIEVENEIETSGSISKDIPKRKIDVWSIVKEKIEHLKSTRLISLEDLFNWVKVCKIVKTIDKSEKLIDNIQKWSKVDVMLDTLKVLEENRSFSRLDLDTWLLINKFIKVGRVNLENVFSKNEIIVWKSVNNYLESILTLKNSGFSLQNIYSWIKLKSHNSQELGKATNTQDEMDSYIVVEAYLRTLSLMREKKVPQNEVESWITVERQLYILLKLSSTFQNHLDSWTKVRRFQMWLKKEGEFYSDDDFSTWVRTKQSLDENATANNIKHKYSDQTKAWKSIEEMLGKWALMFSTPITKKDVIFWLKVESLMSTSVRNGVISLTQIDHWAKIQTDFVWKYRNLIYPESSSIPQVNHDIKETPETPGKNAVLFSNFQNGESNIRKLSELYRVHLKELYGIENKLSKKTNHPTPKPKIEIGDVETTFQHMLNGLNVEQAFLKSSNEKDIRFATPMRIGDIIHNKRNNGLSPIQLTSLRGLQQNYLNNTSLSKRIKKLQSTRNIAYKQNFKKFGLLQNRTIQDIDKTNKTESIIRSRKQKGIGLAETGRSPVNIYFNQLAIQIPAEYFQNGLHTKVNDTSKKEFLTTKDKYNNNQPKERALPYNDELIQNKLKNKRTPLELTLNSERYFKDPVKVNDQPFDNESQRISQYTKLDTEKYINRNKALDLFSDDLSLKSKTLKHRGLNSPFERIDNDVSRYRILNNTSNSTLSNIKSFRQSQIYSDSKNKKITTEYKNYNINEEEKETKTSPTASSDFFEQLKKYKSKNKSIF